MGLIASVWPCSDASARRGHRPVGTVRVVGVLTVCHPASDLGSADSVSVEDPASFQPSLRQFSPPEAIVPSRQSATGAGLALGRPDARASPGSPRGSLPTSPTSPSRESIRPIPGPIAAALLKRVKELVRRYNLRQKLGQDRKRVPVTLADIESDEQFFQKLAVALLQELGASRERLASALKLDRVGLRLMLARAVAESMGPEALGMFETSQIDPPGSPELSSAVSPNRVSPLRGLSPPVLPSSPSNARPSIVELWSKAMEALPSTTSRPLHRKRSLRRQHPPSSPTRTGVFSPTPADQAVGVITEQQPPDKPVEVSLSPTIHWSPPLRASALRVPGPLSARAAKTRHSVQVCARICPLRPHSEASATLAFDPGSNTISITPPSSVSNQERQAFEFDACFDSSTPGAVGYATQADVFSVVGVPAIRAAWRGFHSAILAYGQTGSGKSYSMSGPVQQLQDSDATDGGLGTVGGHPLEGVTPRLCRLLFHLIDQCHASHAQESAERFDAARLEVSAVELYNEVLRDLLAPVNQPVEEDEGGPPKTPWGGHRTAARKTRSLRVCETPDEGVIIRGLSWHAVTTFDEAMLLLEDSNRLRAVAATERNAASSRSHAIVMLRLTQTSIDPQTGERLQRSATIRLGDLAGCENASEGGNTLSIASGVAAIARASTSSVEARRRETGSINKSLFHLGHCLALLADASQPRGETFLPWRGSVLTMLLRDCLGGRAQLSVLTTLSPESQDFRTTLSTLRFADRARRIVTTARPEHVRRDVVQADVAKQISELRELVSLRSPTIARRALARAKTKEESFDPDLPEWQELPDAEKEMLETAEALEYNLESLTRPWEEVKRQTEQLGEDRSDFMRFMGLVPSAQEAEGLGVPFLSNLDSDPARDGCLVYPLQHARTVVGSASSVVGPAPTVRLVAPDVLPVHCVILQTSRRTVRVLCAPGALVRINGRTVAPFQGDFDPPSLPEAQGMALRTGDTLEIGSTLQFRAHAIPDGGDEDDSEEPPPPTVNQMQLSVAHLGAGRPAVAQLEQALGEASSRCMLANRLSAMLAQDLQFEPELGIGASSPAATDGPPSDLLASLFGSGALCVRIVLSYRLGAVTEVGEKDPFGHKALAQWTLKRLLKSARIPSRLLMDYAGSAQEGGTPPWAAALDLSLPSSVCLRPQSCVLAIFPPDQFEQVLSVLQELVLTARSSKASGVVGHFLPTSPQTRRPQALLAPGLSHSLLQAIEAELGFSMALPAPARPPNAPSPQSPASTPAAPVVAPAPPELQLPSQSEPAMTSVVSPASSVATPSVSINVIKIGSSPDGLHHGSSGLEGQLITDRAASTVAYVMGARHSSSPRTLLQGSPDQRQLLSANSEASNLDDDEPLEEPDFDDAVMPVTHPDQLDDMWNPSPGSSVAASLRSPAMSVSSRDGGKGPSDGGSPLAGHSSHAEVHRLRAGVSALLAENARLLRLLQAEGEARHRAETTAVLSSDFPRDMSGPPSKSEIDTIDGMLQDLQHSIRARTDMSALINSVNADDLVGSFLP
jgi:hypothetical protein